MNDLGQADERRGQAARPPAAHQAALVAQPSHTVPGAGPLPYSILYSMS